MGGTLDMITGAFVMSLKTGAVALSQYSLGILGFTALIAWCSSLWPVLMANENGLATGLMLAVRIAIFYWITSVLALLGIALFHSFLGWGTAPSGGVFTERHFMSPSSMLDQGLVAAKPIQDFLKRYQGLEVLGNLHIVLGYMLAFWIIVLSFALITFHLIVTIIEFHMALMVGAVLIPWGALSATAFLCEFSIAWIVSGLIRVLLTAAIMSISIPLFRTLSFTITPGGDPSFTGAVIFALTACIFAILAWQIPSRAAAVGGRGMALALTGGVLIPSSGVKAVMAAGGYAAQMAGGAAYGASRLLSAMRR